MSYAGLGQILRSGTAPITGLSVSAPASAPASAMVDVGVPPTLVKLFGTGLWNLAQTMGTADPGRAMYTFVGAAMGGGPRPPVLRLNAFGLVDPAWVTTVLGALPVNLRTFADRALGGPNVTRFLADIAAGKYAGHPPTISLAPISLSPLRTGLVVAQTSAAQKMAAANQLQIVAQTQKQTATTTQQAQAADQTQAQANAATAAAAAAQAAVDAAALLAQQPAAQVECTDGYYRDTTGLCVPNAAAPGPAAQPDVSQVTAPPFVDDMYGPPHPDPASTPPPGTPGGGPVIRSPGFLNTAPLGVDLKWWVLGAAGVGIAAIVLSSRKSVTANPRRRRGRRH